jgi:hypothetical protein
MQYNGLSCNNKTFRNQKVIWRFIIINQMVLIEIVCLVGWH